MVDEIKYFEYYRDSYKKLIENSRLVSLSLNVLNSTDISQAQLKEKDKLQKGSTLVFKISQCNFNQEDIENILKVHAPIGTTHFECKEGGKNTKDHVAKFRFYRILPEDPYKYIKN